MEATLCKGRTSLSSDKREISGVYMGPAGWEVGQQGITKIVAYDENGEMGMVPWLALFQGDEIKHRIPARETVVTYRTEAEKAFER